MKKYIRTNESVYRLHIGKDKKVINRYRIQYNERLRFSYSKEKIKEYNFKQANTIEELCDCFVGINGEEREITSSINAFPFNREYDEIYAAIWTDKGLKYVAKLNDRGELKLI